MQKIKFRSRKIGAKKSRSNTTFQKILCGSLLVLTFGQLLFPHIDAIAANFREQKLRDLAGSILQKSAPSDAHPEKIQTEADSRADLAFKILNFLPGEHADSLRKVEIFDETELGPRGAANHSRMELRPQNISDAEFAAVFLHEIGHVVDLGFLKPENSRGEFSPFRDGRNRILKSDPSTDFYAISWKSAEKILPKTQFSDFVSGYAQTNVFEDFAESYIFYILHGDLFRTKIADNSALNKKYTFLKEIVFGGRTFSFARAGSSLAQSFDTTILAYNFDKFSDEIEDESEKTNRTFARRTRIRRVGSGSKIRRARTSAARNRISRTIGNLGGRG